MAEQFAEALNVARERDPGEQRFLWEEAARLAGIPGDDVRVASKSGVVYLLGQDWVVAPDADGWHVRAWEDEADPFYEEALDLAALDDDGALG